jgi:hypothetical protein
MSQSIRVAAMEFLGVLFPTFLGGLDAALSDCAADARTVQAHN